MGAKLKDGLTVAQRLFAHEYSIDGNGTRAARDAGYKGDDNVLATIAKENIRKPQISALIESILSKRISKIDNTAERILERLHHISELDLAECFDENGQFKHIHDIPVEVRKCIKSIDVFEEWDGVGRDRHKMGEIRRITFWDKIKSNELLGRHKKLFNEVKEHKHSLTLEQLVGGSNTDPKDVTPSGQPTLLSGGKDETGGSSQR